jgi:hypothetical protein
MPTFAFEKSCAELVHVVPDGQFVGESISQSWKHFRFPTAPRQVNSAAQ